MRYYPWRWIPVVAMLAALWAVLELSVGTGLHLLKMPFTGAIMSCLSLPLMLAARRSLPHFGAVTTVGLVAGSVRWFLGGAFGPLISLAIFLEAMIVDAGLGFGQVRGISRFRAVLAGALCLGYSALHPILFWGVLLGGGRGIVLPKGFVSILSASGVWGVHLVIGGCAGYWAWRFLNRLPETLFERVRPLAIEAVPKSPIPDQDQHGER
ncbi:MAG: hypothetical protein NTW14_05550 [bacterium]|nr:hypothetical protein [bacterium]